MLMTNPTSVAVIVFNTPETACGKVYNTCMPLFDSARKHRITLKWLSFREMYYDSCYERHVRLMDSLYSLEGQSHGLIIQSKNTFTKPLDKILEDFEYIPGTLLVTAPTREPSYKRKEFLTTLSEEGVAHDTSIMFGDLPTLKEYSQEILELSMEFLSGSARPGLAMDCVVDNKDFIPNLGKYARDEHLLSQVLSVYYPDKFKVVDIQL